MTIRNLCLHSDYNKFELPIQEGVNIIDIGIDITDVLRINDKGASADSVINDKPMTNETQIMGICKSLTTSTKRPVSGVRYRVQFLFQRDVARAEAACP